MTNLDHIGILNNIRLVLLSLGKDEIKVIRFSCKDGKGIIEVEPDERLLATDQAGGFNRYIEHGITIFWK